MSRINIFELLIKNNNIQKDASRLDALFDSYYFVEEFPRKAYTLKEFVDKYCFRKWLGRGRCLDADDFLETVGYSDMERLAQENHLDSFILLIEVIYNFWYLATTYGDQNSDNLQYYGTVHMLQEAMDACLSEYNQKAFYFPEQQKCIIAEDMPQITAAAEATDPETAIEIVRYNHRQLAGDIARKKAILKTLGDNLEGRKEQISGINQSLYNNITGALNNLNIRHNNTSPENRSTYHRAVAEMSEKELEEHYDDLYQLILLAFLEMDNVQRQRDMKDLVKRINLR